MLSRRCERRWTFLQVECPLGTIIVVVLEAVAVILTGSSKVVIRRDEADRLNVFDDLIFQLRIMLELERSTEHRLEGV